MAFAAGIILAFHYLAAAQNNPSMSMKTKILFVVTSHDQKGNTGEPTGYYLSEVSHPWEVLHNAGYVIDFVSPKGGKAPVDGFNLDDNVNSKFWNDKTYRYKVEHTLNPRKLILTTMQRSFTQAGTAQCGTWPTIPNSPKSLRPSMNKMALSVQYWKIR